MLAEFVKIDLHIHTPASVSDYKGMKDDNEYFAILKEAKSKHLSIIAFADHNSIQGYKRILELKATLYIQRNSISQITDSDQGKSLLNDIDSRLSLFQDILILPGIEFEVNDGIHLLVIFNQNTTVQQIDKFLSDGGYSPNDFGLETPSTFAKWDIFTLYEESKKYDCLVIDPHTDSNKGIYNTIPKGNTRAHCFSSPQLNAVCFKSE